MKSKPLTPENRKQILKSVDETVRFNVLRRGRTGDKARQMAYSTVVQYGNMGWHLAAKECRLIFGAAPGNIEANRLYHRIKGTKPGPVPNALLNAVRAKHIKSKKSKLKGPKGPQRKTDESILLFRRAVVALETIAKTLKTTLTPGA